MSKGELRDDIVKAMASCLGVPLEDLYFHMNDDMEEFFSCDSMDKIDVILSLEQSFHFTSVSEDLDKLHTPSDIVGYALLRIEMEEEEKLGKLALSK